jgi:2'-5' RNA ligase
MAATDGQMSASTSAPSQNAWRRRPPPPPLPRPDHFIALRVPPAASQPAFDVLHASLGALGFGATLVDSAAAHVTLGVLRLSAASPNNGAQEEETSPPVDPTRLASAVAALRTAGAALRGSGPLALTLGPGVSTFGQRVVYLEAGDGSGGASLRAVEAAVRGALEGVGLVVGEGAGGPVAAAQGTRRDRRPRQPQQIFTPHVTVAKTWSGGRVKAIPPSAVSSAVAELQACGWERASFVAGTLQLCAMGGRQAGQYYRVVEEVDFGGASI